MSIHVLHFHKAFCLRCQGREYGGCLIWTKFINIKPRAREIQVATVINRPRCQPSPANGGSLLPPMILSHLRCRPIALNFELVSFWCNIQLWYWFSIFQNTAFSTSLVNNSLMTTYDRRRRHFDSWTSYPISEYFMIEGYSYNFDAIIADLSQIEVNDSQGDSPYLVTKILWLRPHYLSKVLILICTVNHAQF